MNQREYKSKPESYWVGKKVRLLRPIQNGGHVFPEGYVMKIERKHGGFKLRSVDICKECGVGVRWVITKVPACYLELLKESHNEQ